MIKILFLDIDGVVKLYNSNNQKDKCGEKFNPELILNLNYIIEQTHCKIVISSMRRSLGLVKFKEMWKFRQYPGEIIDITPTSEISRGEDIKMWLDNNKFDSYCIVDDLDADEFLLEQLLNFVKIERKIGLTVENCNKIITILNAYS